LVTSLYAAGRPEYRKGPSDPSPGVPSITAVMPRLNLRRLDQVVEVDPSGEWVIAQARCRLDGLALLLARRELALALGPAPSTGAGGTGGRTAGAAVIAGRVAALWVDVLTTSGEVTRHAQDALPPDALVVAAALATEPVRA
jgi:FAD/FMN-containing dehydrogenase